MDPALEAACARAVAQVRDLELLVLHGSRARGDAGPRSDWDLAFLGGGALDASELLAVLVSALATEEVDLADLSLGSAKLRFDVARDGRPLFEGRPGRWHAFQLEAAHFWCDAGPVIQAANRALLHGLGAA